MEFKMVNPNGGEDQQDVTSFTIQSYEDLSINLIHEGKKLSEVWKYYGLLYNGSTVMNTQRYYCSLCFKELLDNINNGLQVSFSTVHNVSISTATGNLKMHLFKGHSVSMLPYPEKDKFDFSFVIKAENKRNRGTVLHEPDTNNIDNDISHIIGNSSLDIGLTEVCSEDTQYMISCYNRMKNSLKQRLQSSNSITILSDLLFNPSVACSYLKLSLAFVDSRWEVNNFFLSYTPLKSGSCDVVRLHYDSVLNELGIRCEGKIHLVGTKMISHVPRISDQEYCTVFQTHKLITKHGLYSSNAIIGLLDKCINIVSILNFRGFPCLEDSASGDSKFEYFNELAEVFLVVRLDEQNPFFLFNDTSSQPKENPKSIIRASVVLYLFTFIQKYSNILAQTLHGLGHAQFILDETEITIIKSCVKFLNEFEEVPDIFRECNNTFIVVPVLKNKIKEFCESSCEDIKVIQQIKCSILSHLDECYQMTPLVKMACILDPSVRDILDKDDTFQLLVNKLRSTSTITPDGKNNSILQFITTTQSPSTKTDISPSSTSKKLKLLKSLKPQYQIPEYEDDYVKEVKQYLQHLPTLEESESPVLFWKNHHHIYPNLSLLAQEHLGVPAYSVSPESLFSVNDLKSTNELFNVNAFRLNTLTFVRNNMELLSQ